MKSPRPVTVDTNIYDKLSRLQLPFSVFVKIKVKCYQVAEDPRLTW